MLRLFLKFLYKTKCAGFTPARRKLVPKNCVRGLHEQFVLAALFYSGLTNAADTPLRIVKLLNL